MTLGLDLTLQIVYRDRELVFFIGVRIYQRTVC